MKKLFTVLLCVAMLTAGVNAAFERVNTYNGDFTDVKNSSWYADNVKTAYELGFMNGKSEGVFDPDGNVTVVEGITLASRLHAAYHGAEIKKSAAMVEEYRFDFDDPEILVDLSQRNSRNTEGVNFNRATGKIEDGVLVCQPDKPNAGGSYDPQIYFKGLELEAKNYNKVTFRMRVEELEDKNPRNRAVEFFFQTSTSPALSTDKQINVKFPSGIDHSQWFDLEADLGNHKLWKDIITNLRFDPSNNNGIYYIDYIVFSKSENIKNEKWYDIYVDYAVENGIIAKDTYSTDDYSRNITRREICNLLAAAIPEEHFAPVNDVKGIPDVLRDEKNADVYLMLYKAGVLLGSDEKGSLKPDADIKRSEISAIINRAALPESRVKGSVSHDWADFGNEYDIEFNDEESLKKVSLNKIDSAEIKNGAFVLNPKDMGEGAKPRFDPQIGIDNISISAEDYTKLKVRIKAEYIGEIADARFDFYFKTDVDNKLSESKAIHKLYDQAGFRDAAGWYVIEVDFATHKDWKSTITGFRFDPANTNAVFTIDYIRLVKADPLKDATHEQLVSQGYKADKLFMDADYEKGFYVNHFEQQPVDMEQRKWQDYADTSEKPLWRLQPIWCTYDLWEHRDDGTDKFTITDDKGINTIKYNPEEKSLSLRLNATKIYNGKPHLLDDPKTPDVDEENYNWWPHLLIEQSYLTFPENERVYLEGADRVFVELDVRVNRFANTTNPEGMNKLQFGPVFYLQSKTSGGEKIWFCLSVLNGTDTLLTTNPSWAPDSAAHQYMYGIPQATVFKGMENSFNPEKGTLLVSEEWKHVRVDITEHLERCIEWANRDKAFYGDVTWDDLFFAGGNLGFEIHGNYDCEIEFKNYNLVAYSKN